MIELIDVNKTFYIHKQKVKALSGVSLSVPEKSITGVLGQSGAGKSTLLRCVNLLERPSSGRVVIAGDELTSMGSSALRQERRNIGMIFQHFNLLRSQSVFDNVAMPLQLLGEDKKRIKARVEELLNLVGLSDKAQAKPWQLSGGQKQRVAIARALATNPKVLLCDEATSALDPKSTLSILQLLQEINKKLGLTILLITHELDVVKRICDRVAIMHEGELVEHGSVLDVFSEPKSLAAKALFAKTVEGQFDAHDKANLVRLTFIGKSTDKAIMSELSFQFQVSANIFEADIESIQNTSIGTMVCQLEGEQGNIEKAVQYMKARHIKVEALT